MNDSPNKPTVEEGVNAMLASAKDKLLERVLDCEQCVRDRPGKSMLIAIAAGYCLHRLPVRSLLVTQVRLLAALAPPTLLAIGAAKLCEFLQGQSRTRSAANVPRGSGVELPEDYQKPRPAPVPFSGNF